MEIINTTYVETGVPTFYLVMSIILWVLAVGALLFAILCWCNNEIILGWQLFGACIFGILGGLGCFFINKVKEPYYKYDVVFTGEEINMQEFLDKYTITSHNGNIYHIEENH